MKQVFFVTLTVLGLTLAAPLVSAANAYTNLFPPHNSNESGGNN